MEKYVGSNRARRTAVCLAALAALILVPTAGFRAAPGDRWTVVEDDEWCRETGRDYCEVREITLPADRDELSIRSTNGSVSLEAWERDEIYIRARVRVNDRGESAEETAGQVSIRTDGTVEARGPKSGWFIFGGNKRWSVSYRVKLPARFDVDARTTNGRLSVAGVAGEIRARSTNGAVMLERIGGDVEGGTTNGGVTAVLEGETWQGNGLYLHATNGGVSVSMPKGYSAELDASATNGGIRVEHPIRLHKKGRGRLTGTIGDGGAVIRVRTTNGGIRFEQSG